MGGPAGRRHDHAFPRAARITRGSDIRAIFQRGKRSRTAHLDVFDSASPGALPRGGAIVPRYGRSIVQRNRVRRRLRELLRREVLPRLRSAGLGVDVLVRARREAYGVPYSILRDELGSWVEKRCSRASSSN